MSLCSMITGVLLGVLASLIVAMFVEWMRKPDLSITILPPQTTYLISRSVATGTCVGLKVCVSNKRLPFIFRWMQRQSARDCRAALHFLREDKTPFIARPMPGRWSGSVQPVPLEGIIRPSMETIEIHDIARLTADSRIHIPAGEEEGLDVAARFPGETDA